MQFVDTHCHLYYRSYKKDLDQVIQRAQEVDVTRIIVPGLNLQTSQEAISLAEKYSSVFAAVGIHPSDVDTFKPDQIKNFEKMLKHSKVVAVGEIGLDYYHRDDNKQSQVTILDMFLKLACEFQKPIILHSRNAFQELLATIRHFIESQSLIRFNGVFHAFEGNFVDAQTVLKLGFSIGIGGPVTYKNASIKHELIEKIDLSKVLLETDGPFLAPQKFRGGRNEPAYIPLIAQKVAELQLCDIKDLARLTTENSNTLFMMD